MSEHSAIKAARVERARQAATKNYPPPNVKRLDASSPAYLAGVEAGKAAMARRLEVLERVHANLVVQHDRVSAYCRRLEQVIENAPGLEFPK